MRTLRGIARGKRADSYALNAELFSLPPFRPVARFSTKDPQPSAAGRHAVRYTLRGRARRIKILRTIVCRRKRGIRSSRYAGRSRRQFPFGVVFLSGAPRPDAFPFRPAAAPAREGSPTKEKSDPEMLAGMAAGPAPSATIPPAVEGGPGRREKTPPETK